MKFLVLLCLFGAAVAYPQTLVGGVTPLGTVGTLGAVPVGTVGVGGLPVGGYPIGGYSIGAPAVVPYTTQGVYPYTTTTGGVVPYYSIVPKVTTHEVVGDRSTEDVPSGRSRRDTSAVRYTTPVQYTGLSQVALSPVVPVPGHFGAGIVPYATAGHVPVTTAGHVPVVAGHHPGAIPLTTGVYPGVAPYVV